MICFATWYLINNVLLCNEFNLLKDNKLTMKKDTHPKYYQATVKCSCGNTFTVGSASETLDTEVCSECHPFYSGKSKKLDIAGRVNKFEKKVTKAKELKEKAGTGKKTRVKKNTRAKKIGK